MTFNQSRQIGVAGNFINQVMGNNCSVPVVGEGATILHYSDREAYEVIAVSDCGTKCTIRRMDYEYAGTESQRAAGDYNVFKHTSNENNSTKDLEYNAKKQQWESVGYEVKIVKALWNRLVKEYGWNAKDNLPDGHTFQSLSVNPDKQYWDRDTQQFQELRVVKGITKNYKNTSAVSIMFGTMQTYIDPHF